MRTSQHKQFTINPTSASTFSLTQKITILSTAIALSPIMAFLCLADPFSISSASATTSKTRTTVNIDPVASIAIEAYDPSTGSYVPSSNPSMIINPESFNTMAARVTTSTNSPTGLTLYMSDSDTNNALVEQGDDPSSPSSPVIFSITNNVTITDSTDSTKAFPVNTWGYAFNANANNNTPPTIPLTYSVVPTTETTIAETDTNGDNAYTFTAGSRVDMSLPAGTYKDQLTFTIIANAVPVPTRTIFDLTTMQEMTPEICSNTTTPLASVTNNFDTDGSHAGDQNYIPSMTLRDARDDQVYTVRKLADGNCWMTENLRFGANLDDSARSWNGTTDPDLTDSGADVTMMANLNASRICTTESDCKTPGNVSMFMSAGDNYTMPYIAIYQANTAATYDSQTKYGVAYNYCAASGGTVCTGSTQTDATSSICPKGWTLPGMSGTSTSSDSIPYSPTKIDGTVDTLDNLVSVYGVTDSSTGRDKMIATPLSFLRSGYFLSGSLHNRSTSGYGYWWSSKASSLTGSFLLYSGSSIVRRSDAYRYLGHSVRCVASS